MKPWRIRIGVIYGRVSEGVTVCSITRDDHQHGPDGGIVLVASISNMSITVDSIIGDGPF